MLTFPLDPHSCTPLYEQIYQAIQQYILDGTLGASAKLPSTRSLASNLGVSRNTVDTAYYQLQAEGYIEASPKSGFYVCDHNPGELGRMPKPCRIHSKTVQTAIPTSHSPKRDRKMAQDEVHTYASPGTDAKQSFLYDFSPFTIDISHFPFSVWKKLSRQCLMDGNDIFLLGDSFGDLPLRQAICDYIRLSREVWCQPEQIVIGAGVDYLLQMLSLTFIQQNLKHITLENPGYMQAALIFRNNGLAISPGSLDEKGLAIPSISPESQLVYVTPSHQYPLGFIMPYRRRKELLGWASAAPDRYIVEDDHDSEFRFKGKPIPSLQGMDEQRRVIYIGTFSKAIAPAIRVGYMVLPPSLLPAYTTICGHYSCTVSRLDQSILTHFLAEGYFEKHVNRMRKIYRNKHDLALSCLHPLIEEYQLKIHGENAGLHLAIELPEHGISEKALIQRAAQEGIHLYGIGDHYLPECGSGPGFPMGSNIKYSMEPSMDFSMESSIVNPHRNGLQKRPADRHLPARPNMSGILLGYSNLSEEEIKKGISHMADTRIFQAQKTVLPSACPSLSAPAADPPRQIFSPSAKNDETGQ